MGVWELIFISCLVSGLVGLILGSQVEKTGQGFLLGFFLGPFGWIIVFLLPRDQERRVVYASQTTEPVKRPSRPDRDLENDSYKVWLGKTYDIKKNELFEKYEFDGNLFESLREALSAADRQDREKEEPENVEAGREPAKFKREDRNAKDERTEYHKSLGISFEGGKYFYGMQEHGYKQLKSAVEFAEKNTGD